jgi:sulfur carrier protein ThiS
VATPGGRGQKVSVKEGSTVADLLGAMDLLREEHIVVLEGHVAIEFQKLKDGDRLQLIRAFSGG